MKKESVKRLFLGILTAVIMILTSGGCSRAKDIKVLSCAVESVAPVGLRGVKVDLSVQIENPSVGFKVSDVNGVLYYKGRPYVRYSAAPVSVDRKSVAVYPVVCDATIVEDVSIFELMAVISNFDKKDFTTDIRFKVGMKKGVAKSFSFKKVPVSRFI